MKDGERKGSLGREVAALHMNSKEFDSWAVMCEIQEYWTSSKDKTEGPVRPKKKNVYVALSRPTVKCEKNRVGFFFFFFFFMSHLGEEFAKICIQWLKKALA